MVQLETNRVHESRTPMIEMRRVHRFFGKTKAVNDISFSVEAGEVFGFIGPNGAGKTTSMRILATLELPSYGDAMIDGLSCVIDPELVRQRMGFMPDGFGMYSNMNCVEYLDFFARAYGLVGRDREKALRRTLDFTGLDKIASKNIKGLSKGMRQRLCLGRAMIHDPKVLILDEPANGLDPRARIELRQLIGRLADEGKAILISSHILTELAEMCHRVAIIERGQLLALGTVDEIQRTKTESSESGERTSVQMRIIAIGKRSELVDWLTSRNGVENVTPMADGVTFTYSESRPAQAELLKSAIDSGFEIAEFALCQKTLEEVFMQVTTGAVQ